MSEYQDPRPGNYAPGNVMPEVTVAAKLQKYEGMTWILHYENKVAVMCPKCHNHLRRYGNLDVVCIYCGYIALSAEPDGPLIRYAGDEDEIRRIRVEEDGTIEKVYRMSLTIKDVEQEFKPGMGKGCFAQRDVCFKIPEKFDPVTLSISLAREKEKFLADSLTVKIEEVKDE